MKSNGIGLGGLLTALFIGLKLTGHITWSWVWVLSPLWLPITVVLTIIALFFVLAAVFNKKPKIINRRRM